jgi:hypothetical protein
MIGGSNDDKKMGSSSDPIYKTDLFLKNYFTQ